jgi:hypothetical protein
VLCQIRCGWTDADSHLECNVWFPRHPRRGAYGQNNWSNIVGLLPWPWQCLPWWVSSVSHRHCETDIVLETVLLVSVYWLLLIKENGVPLHAMKALGGKEVYNSYSFSTSTLGWGEWSVSRPRDRMPGTCCTGGWVGPRASLDTEARGKILSPLPGFEPRSPGRPAHSQTLYTDWATQLNYR